MSWTVLLVLCAVSYALKAVGPVLAGGRELGHGPASASTSSRCRSSRP